MAETASLEPLTSREYLDSLDDGREVWIHGQRVARVTEHPAFRNAARMVARLYDALHDPARRDVLTMPTEWGGRTHRFFRASADAAEQLAARDAIVAWQRMGWGWMGRTPDYKGAFLGTLGANAAFYRGHEQAALAWYRKAQERTWYINHALINPPVDRQRATADGNDVFVRVEQETDAGIVVSGAKVVATNAALTHFTFVAHLSPVPIRDPRFAPVFMVPTNAPGLKLVCRTSHEFRAAVAGGPFDYPLSSRLDENDAIFILDRVFVPWEDVFMVGDADAANGFGLGSGFRERASLHGCTRLAVKLDFLSGLLARALALTGTAEHRGLRVQLGEVLAWRNAFWGLSDAMAKSEVPWGGMVLPDARFAGAYRVLNQVAVPRVQQIIQQAVASGLVYVNSHASDFAAPEIEPLLARYLRGSDGSPAAERVKVMKLLWDAVGSEFAGRHELYELNYIGGDEVTRLTNLAAAEASGDLARCMAFAQGCMDEYDLGGWRVGDLVDPDDVSVLPRPGRG